jgi:hypothetical protein
MERWVDLNDLVDAAMIAERLGYKNPSRSTYSGAATPTSPSP